VAFRDELEASRARVQQLQQEVDTLRAERASTEELEQKLEKLSGTLEEAQAELSRLKAARGSAPGGSRVGLASLVAILALGLGIGIVWLVRSVPDEAEAPAPTQEPPSPPPEPPKIAELLLPPPAPLPTITAPQADLVWHGKVKTASGSEVAPGTPCTLEVHLRPLRTWHVKLGCGKTPLYDSEAKLDGMSQTSSGLYERFDGDAAFRYQVVYSDIGTRTGERAQITLDGNAKQAVAFRETAPLYRVEVELEPMSDARTGPPLVVAADASRAALQRRAEVRVVTGKAPVKVGDACTLDLRVDGASKEEIECRASLECGKRRLYGGKDLGYARCELDPSGRPARFVDDVIAKDGSLQVDLGAATANAAAADWSVDLALLPPP
jgi:hypothetical protein